MQELTIFQIFTLPITFLTQTTDYIRQKSGCFKNAEIHRYCG